MNMIYKFTLTYGGNTYDVHPVYKDDLSINYERESNQMFFREKLSGDIVFVGKEAQDIIGAAFETEFVMDIYSSTNNGLSWSEFHKSRFYMTDCKIDADNKKVTVKPDVKDSYQGVIDALEKEYNLIDLLPVTEKVTMKKRALLQLYGGDDKVTNVFGGFSWEQDFDMGNETPAHFHFQSNLEIAVIRFTRVFWPEGLNGLQKAFICQPDSNGEFDTTNGEGVYKLKRVKWSDSSWDLQLRLLSDDTLVAHSWAPYILMNDSLNFVTSNDVAWGSALCEYLGVMARWLCDVQSFTVAGQSYTASKITSDDPCYGGNLHYVIEANVTIVASESFSETPTKWGKADDTHYYDRPTEYGYFIPVARSYWGASSLWYKQQTSDWQDIEPAMQKSYTLNDSYPLWSVISVLLQASNTGVTFGNTTEFSEFLYSAINPVYGQQIGVPNITPKSNILVGEYTQPAMKAPITLQDVFNMLAKAFKCYWFIDSQNRLRIEHVSWFKNGGSYGGTHQIGIDLTAIFQPRNGKAWSFGTSSWQYDKVDMPARYQYKWMDAGTDVFDGFPFEMLSTFVQTDKVEEISISNFTSDVDFMQIAPEDCSKDGFALLLVMNDGNGNYLPIVTNSRILNGGLCFYKSQNYWASLKFLQLAFLCYDLPSRLYEYDGAEKTAPDIMRGKRQTVIIPYGNATPDVMKLVKTAMGDGQIKQMTLELSSRTGKATLLYDTYELITE